MYLQNKAEAYKYDPRTVCPDLSVQMLMGKHYRTAEDIFLLTLHL